VKGGSPRFLIVRLSAFGDCLHAVPALVALRRHFPNSEIGWAIEDLSHGLLKGHPMVDTFHVFPRRAYKGANSSLVERVRAMRNFRKELSAVKYDVSLDIQGLTKSGLVSWWSGAKRRIGFKGQDSREFNIIFNNERVEPTENDIHVVEKNLALLRPLGVVLPDRPEWVMPSYEPECAAMRPFLKDSGLLDAKGNVARYAIVNPGATWFTKRWPPELFGEVAKGLIERHGLSVVIPWAGADEHKAGQIIARIGGPRALVAPDTDLRQLAALTMQSVLFVGNDTGPLHLAVALNVPSVAIFGATDPLRNGPYGSMNRMQTGGVECHPCWKTTCERKDRACLMRVLPETVLTSCAHVLKRRDSERGIQPAC
jgi:lipopolysaccharide heptosyltransferase I